MTRRIPTLLALTGTLLLVPSGVMGQLPSLADAMGALRAGRYEEAIGSLRDLSRLPDPPASLLRSYARALLEVGRQDEARRVVGGGGGRASSVELENVFGELHFAAGHLPEAEEAFRRSMDGGASDANVARLNLGVLLWDRGDRDDALALFDSFIDLYNGARTRLSSEELMAVGTAVRYLGITNPSLYQDALMAFDDAAEMDPDDPRPDILAGELFLEKYRATDARESFRPVLEMNPRQPRALLGQARILDFEGLGGSIELVLRALEVNPRFVDARAFLASLYLKTGEYERARREAEEALKSNPVHLGALSILASSYFLEGDMAAYEEVAGRVRALNPTYPDLYLTVAENAVAQRQYQTAVNLAQHAVELDPSSWRGFGVLGMNQLRTGAVEAGQANLEKAFAGDPYNPWYKNTLDLLDTFGRFETVTTDHFKIFLDHDEAGLLGPYAAATAEEAFSALRERYGATPPIPIRLEIYPSHSDFSVRTLGLTGLGALGVSFGSTLVMDSPSAMGQGEFNWASTMWHEVSHAFHLAMSDHRVPRWFTEGLAVHEQHKASPEWGFRASPAWLQAYQAGRLHPVSGMNEGFIRPDYPEQVVFSYFQASVVFDLIESRWGMDAILGMLRGYGDGMSNSEVFREVLGTTPEAFDETFDEYVRERWGREMEAVSFASEEDAARVAHTALQDLEGLRLTALQYPGNFQSRLAYGRGLLAQGRFDQAEVELRAALSLFPDYGGTDSPYLYLAEIHIERGETEKAARALQQLGYRNEVAYSVHLREAELWLELGEETEAARALEKAVEIVPFDLDAHLKLAELLEELGDREGSVRERRAVLAMDPPDLAEAYYRLALALAGAGDRVEARSQLLRALDLAPSYEAALELLLELRGGGRDLTGGKTMEEGGQ